MDQYWSAARGFRTPVLNLTWEVTLHHIYNILLVIQVICIQCRRRFTQRHESPGGHPRGCLPDSNHEIYRADEDEIWDDHR